MACVYVGAHILGPLLAKATAGETAKVVAGVVGLVAIDLAMGVGVGYC